MANFLLDSRAPTSNIVSYTTFEDSDFFDKSWVSRSGATVNYGPFKTIPAGISTTLEFITETQRRVNIHYEYNEPLLEVINMKRVAEISHWGSNLNIQDEIFLHNAGPKYVFLIIRRATFHSQHVSDWKVIFRV